MDCWAARWRTHKHSLTHGLWSVLWIMQGHWTPLDIFGYIWRVWIVLVFFWFLRCSRLHRHGGPLSRGSSFSAEITCGCLWYACGLWPSSGRKSDSILIRMWSGIYSSEWWGPGVCIHVVLRVPGLALGRSKLPSVAQTTSNAFDVACTLQGAQPALRYPFWLDFWPSALIHHGFRSP